MPEKTEPEFQENQSFSDKEVIENMQKYIKELQLFSDQPKFNSLLYQGMTMILEKLTKLETRLNETEKKSKD